MPPVAEMRSYTSCSQQRHARIASCAPVSAVTRLSLKAANPSGGHNNMNSQITGLLVASVVFGLMAIAQLARLLIRPEVIVGGYAMPLWPSVVAFIVLGGLCLWLWKLARTPTK